MVQHTWAELQLKLELLLLHPGQELYCLAFTIPAWHTPPQKKAPSKPTDSGTTMALQVAGKTAFITGAGSGICLEFAKLLLEQGCNVVVADLALTPAADEAFRPFQSAAGEAKKTPGVAFVHCDVTDWKQLRAAFDAAVENFGGIDVVCPGAGVFEPVRRCRLLVSPYTHSSRTSSTSP